MKKKFLKEEEIQKSDDQYGVYESDSTGTEAYYKMSPFATDFVYTSGINSMTEELECNWILDVVASYRSEIKKIGLTFFTVRIVKDLIDENDEDSGEGCLFFITDGNGKNLISQKIEYTDLGKNLKMFMQYDGTYYCLMQPSEY